jgi:2-haloacid dehalogenase
MNDSKAIQACVFDAYGTLFDVHSAVARHQSRLGGEATAISRLWRTKQLEYTWLRTLMGHYRDFEAVTADALDYALDSHGITDDDLRTKLLLAYMSLDCYPEVPQVLNTLKESGVRIAILSNGSPSMLEAAVESSGLSNLFDAVVSVHGLRIFKPDPRVYRSACDILNVEPGNVMFLSSNAWDAVGAKAFGFHVTWINRFSQRRERLGFEPDHEVSDLNALPNLIGITA